MKYAVIKIINGNYAIHSEGFTDINKAYVSYHGFLSALYNDIDSVESFCVILMNESGMAVERATYAKLVEEPVIVDIPAEDIPAEVEENKE